MPELINYKNKWKGSYETLGFDTSDGDLDFGQYAISKKGYYIRTKPKNEGQFDLVELSYDVSKLKEVKIKGHAYYHEFRKADGVTERIQTDYDGYWNLSKIKAYPQPERYEMVNEIPYFAEDELPPPPEHNSIAHDSSTDSGLKSNVSSFTWSHTCTGSDLTLIVGVSSHDVTTNNRPVSSITYNSDTVTKIDEQDNDTDDILASLWYRAAPDSGGSYTIEVTMGGIIYRVCGGATSLTGTAASPIGASNKASDSGASSPANVIVTTTQANSWVHDIATVKGFSITVGADQTERWTDTLFTSIYFKGSTETTTNTGDVTMSWTWLFGTGNYSIVAAEIKEKTGAAATQTSQAFITG